MPLHKPQNYQKNQKTSKEVENMIDSECTTDSSYDRLRQATQCIMTSVFPSVSPQPSLTFSQGGYKKLMK